MSRTITRILVPTDFSAASDLALDYAIVLAKRFGTSLQLLHVVDDPFVAPGFGAEIYVASVPSLRATLIDEAAARLASLLARAKRQAIPAGSEVRVGPPAEIIRGVAEEGACDLIVMGTHGRSGMAYFFMGSVAEKMVREAPCPVLTVRGDTAERLASEPSLLEHELVPTE